MAKKLGKAAYNLKTAPVRAKAKLLEKGARAIGADGIADAAGKIAKPLNKGGRVGLNKGGQPSYKNGEMPSAKPN